MRDWFGILMFAIAVICVLLIAFGMHAAFAQDEIIPVPRKQLEQLVTEHMAALMALDAAEKEVARLKVKLACV